MFPASVVLSLGVLGDAQRFFPASLPQRRDGMLVPGAQRSTHAAASEEEGGGGGQQGGAAAVPARRRLPPNLGELLGRGVAAWAAQLPPSIPQHMRTLMQESALLELRRRFQLAEVVVQEEAEQQQQQRARQRRAPARRQAELSAAEKWRARREQLERAAAALAEIEQLAADGLAAADAATVLRELRQAAQRAYSAILLRMFAVREGYGLWSPEHQRAYGLYLRMQKLAGVPMQLIYSAEEAEECALLRHYLAQGSNKRQRQQ